MYFFLANRLFFLCFLASFENKKLVDFKLKLTKLIFPMLKLWRVKYNLKNKRFFSNQYVLICQNALNLFLFAVIIVFSSILTLNFSILFESRIELFVHEYFLFIQIQSQTLGTSKLVRDVKNAIVDLLLKANNVIWTQENASVNRPLLDDDVIGVNWVIMVTLQMAAKVRNRFIFLIIISLFFLCMIFRGI